MERITVVCEGVKLCRIRRVKVYPLSVAAVKILYSVS